MPQPFARFDALCLGVSLVGLASWIVVPENRIAGLALIVAGLFEFGATGPLGRRARDGRKTGFDSSSRLCLRAARLSAERSCSVDDRGSLERRAARMGRWGRRRHDSGGHDPRQPRAYRKQAPRRSRHTGIYAAALGAALARIFAALAPQWSFLLLHIAAFSWVAAFLGFAIVYGRALLRPRQN